ncbi:hypothetical protein T01_8617 [Trichinella spiralis]|uniref:Uncharacterized protein n=1 Tax=Trichinella spiralis TaxID=6334 RepID=A0A0V1BEN8_TRISP|nr:hypothetical protein T01_8617 [Trichinella spiralis]
MTPDGACKETLPHRCYQPCYLSIVVGRIHCMIPHGEIRAQHLDQRAFSFGFLKDLAFLHPNAANIRQ